MERDARAARSAAPPLPGRRRRPSAAAAAAASPVWPAFPGESNQTSASASRGGSAGGSGKSSPGTCKSPNQMNHGTSSSAMRSKASCCNSCRPSQFHHQKQSHNQQQNHHQSNQQQQQQQRSSSSSSSRKMEYDDVFGGPPKSVAISSPSSSSIKLETKLPNPDYDDIFRVPKLQHQSSSSSSPAASRTTSKPRISLELPVFDPPEYCGIEVLHAAQKKTPEVEVEYDDVFGGPLTGPRTKFLKDLLKCSGYKGGSKSKGTYHSDSSPISSMQSVNPVYEFDTSDVFGGTPRKSPSNMQGRASTSACSSPFAEPSKLAFSPSTLNDKTYRDVSQRSAEVEITPDSPSSSGSLELDFQERGSFTKFGRVQRSPRSSGRKSTTTAHIQVSSPVVMTSSNEESPEVETLNIPKISVRTGREEHEEANLESEIKSFLEEVVGKDASFVNNVKLQQPTETSTAQPPARQAEVFSEHEMSELFESEAFMEYSIRDLDGLVAEEYVVSHESISESSPSSVSVTNSMNTSPSYEAEGSDSSDKRKVGRRSMNTTYLEKNSARKTSEKQLHDRQEQMEMLEKVFEKVFEKNATQTELRTDSNAVPNENNVSKEGEKIGAEYTQQEDPLERSKLSREGSGPSSSSSFGEWSAACDFGEIEGETPKRRKSRWERHQRASERVAKALAEKLDRDIENDRVGAEKERIAELLDDVIKRWAAGKQGNLRALLSTLQYILWPECGWRPVSLMDIIEPASVRKAYRKATLCVHPDKLQQKGGSIEHKYIAEKLFDYLQEAWTVFNYEQLF